MNRPLPPQTMPLVGLPVPRRPVPPLAEVLGRHAGALAGPMALIFVEDGVEVASTIRHHLDGGFRTVLLCLADTTELPAEVEDLKGVVPARHDPRPAGAVMAAVNAVLAVVADGTWIYHGYNGEYLFHPFCETRSIREMLAFHAEERRPSLFTTVIDLYPAGPAVAVDMSDRSNLFLDSRGYYSLPRTDAQGQALDRQVEVFGGLRWRFDDHVPPDRRRIDRIALFQARKGLRMLPDHRFSDAEYNTCACPWHHNLTGCVMSLRAAKALRANPGSLAAIERLDWAGSVRFEGTSQQLMDLGLMEPGQWF